MVSKKCTYALKAVLALARNAGGSPMTIQEIASAESIPPRFLEAILRDLKQSGLTDSIRGKDGGYKLAQLPSRITMGQVVRAVEAPWFPEEDGAGRDVFAAVWSQASEHLDRLLDEKDFQTLLNEQEALRGETVLNYSI